MTNPTFATAPHVVPPRLFDPRSVAIVGASSDPAKLGYRPVEYLRRVGYAGEIYLVNPRTSSIDGLAVFPDIASLPAVPDVALLVVPAQQALGAAEDCARAGVTAVIVASTGFAEAGGEGVVRQRALAELTLRHGTRFVGPNTNGLYNSHRRLSLGYNAAHGEVFEPGSVSIVSHSGALFATLASRMRGDGVGLAKFVAVGNEVDLNLLDFVDHLIDDAETETLLLVLEALSDGPRFVHAARRARGAGKRIVALKLGASRAGAAATEAHSSRMAGDARAYEALFEAAGVARVSSVEALVACARLRLLAPRGWVPRGTSVALVTASGGGGTLLADAVAAEGLGMAALSAATASRLDAIRGDGLPALANPLDVTAVGGTARSAETVGLVAADDGVDAVIAFLHTLPSARGREAFGAALGAVPSAFGKPCVVFAPGALPADQEALFARHGVAVLRDTASGMQALAGLLRLAAPLAAEAVIDRPIVIAHDSGTPVLDEFESMQLLESAGIACIEREAIQTLEQARAFSVRHAATVVLKGRVRGIAHKSDHGLVALGLDTPDRIDAAWERLRHAMAALGQQSPADVVVQRMVASAELEFIVGVSCQAPLGRFLLFGLGGRHAETLDVVEVVALPVARENLGKRVRGSRVGQVLAGPRWPFARSLEDLVDTLCRLQALALATGTSLKAVEINPLHLGGDGALALDALVVMKDSEHLR